MCFSVQKNRLIEAVLLSSHNMFWMRNKENNFLIWRPDFPLTLYMLVSTFVCLVSAANFCKQFGPRAGPTFSGSNLFDTQMLQEEFFQKSIFKKIVSRWRRHE